MSVTKQDTETRPAIPGTIRRVILGAVLPPAVAAAVFTLAAATLDQNPGALLGFFGLALVLGAFLVGVPALLFSLALEWVNRRTERSALVVAIGAGFGALSGYFLDGPTDMEVPLFTLLGTAVGAVVAAVIRRMFLRARAASEG